MRNKNVFWGIVLLAAAAALLLGRLGYLEGVGFWPIIFNIGLLCLTKIDLNRSSGHIRIQYFLGAQRSIRTDKSTKRFWVMECPRRVTDQDCSIFYSVQLSFIAVNVIFPAASGHKADIPVCFPYMKGQPADAAFYAAWLQEAVRPQCTCCIEAPF